MSNLEIKQGENKFYIGDDENNALAEITYRFVDNNEINIDHTGVSDELGGQGVGKNYLKQLLNTLEKIIWKLLPHVHLPNIC